MRFLAFHEWYKLQNWPVLEIRIVWKWQGIYCTVWKERLSFFYCYQYLAYSLIRNWRIIETKFFFLVLNLIQNACYWLLAKVFKYLHVNVFYLSFYRFSFDLFRQTLLRRLNSELLYWLVRHGSSSHFRHWVSVATVYRFILFFPFQYAGRFGVIRLLRKLLFALRSFGFFEVFYHLTAI